MKSAHEELVARNAAIQELLDSGVEAQLRAIPGIRHVAVGLKERGRALTDTLCIRVYVDEKLPAEQLELATHIPESIRDVPTDVVVLRKTNPRFSLDTQRYRPVKGGTLISNRIIVLNTAGNGTTMQAGTFGCTATRITDSSVMLLTNWHVLLLNGGDIGSPVFQPPPIPIPPVDLADLPIFPKDDENKIAEVAGFAITEKVDGAIARLDVSSCCRCCGIDWRDEIVGLSEDGIPPSDKLLGLRAAVAGETVIIVGVSMGRSEGRVVVTNAPDFTINRPPRSFTFKGQIEIASEDTLMPFSVDGDSGAVVVGEDGFIVGLLFASDGDFPPDGRSYANHISDVTSALGITINLDRSTHDTAGAAVAPVNIRPSDRDVAVYEAARERLFAHPAGRWLWALAERHREEVVALITNSRPGKVAWQRAHGPALFAQALNTLRAGGDELPAPADGSTLESALARMGDVLRAQGSAVLRADIDAHGDALLQALRTCSTFAELLEGLVVEA